MVDEPSACIRIFSTAFIKFEDHIEPRLLPHSGIALSASPCTAPTYNSRTQGAAAPGLDSGPAHGWPPARVRRVAHSRKLEPPLPLPRWRTKT